VVGSALPHLTLHDVTKAFPNPVGGEQPLLALAGVTFNAERGQFCCLVGTSGCGKSTLLRLIAGLIHADQGEIRINNRPITAPGADRGMVFQSFNLLPWRTVIGNIEYGMEMLGIPRPERRARAQTYLERAGLAGFERYLPAQLSGGMQQRVGLARALAIEPQMLLMDEPFGALDALTREAMQSDLMRLWTATATTMIFVTHDIEEAVFLADTVFVMSGRPGAIAEAIPVPFPRPRPDNLRHTAAFAALRGEVSHALRAANEAVS